MACREAGEKSIGTSTFWIRRGLVALPDVLEAGALRRTGGLARPLIVFML